MIKFFRDFLLPLALMFGMTVREFWKEDPDLLWAYRKSYMDKIELERNMANYKSWLSGLYVYDAVSKSIYNNFGRKNGAQTLSYIESPYDFNKTKEEIERENQLKMEEEIRKRNQKIKELLNKKK